MMRTLLSIAGIGAAAALFFLYTSPAYNQVKAQQAQMQEYDQALEKANELQRLKQTLLSRYNAFNPNDIARLHKMLPDHVDNVRLILDLDGLAARHGVTLQNVVINAVVESGADQTAVATIGASRDRYGSLSLKFTTQGSYETFVSFLKDLEASLRIVDITSLSIDNLNVRDAIPQYNFDITLKTYWLK